MNRSTLVNIGVYLTVAMMAAHFFLGQHWLGPIIAVALPLLLVMRLTLDMKHFEQRRKLRDHDATHLEDSNDKRL